jgi:hypothetical protein
LPSAHEGNDAEQRAKQRENRQRKDEQRNALAGVEHVACDRMRDQNGGDQAEHDRKSDQRCEISLIARLQQRVFGIVRVDMDVDAGADRISCHRPQGEHARRERRPTDADLVALDVLAADAIAIMDDGGGIVEIVRYVAGRLIYP